MGEIKSTLDIVMEKTKHLSMSDEEKKAQKKDEAGKNIKGLIQKYKDRILDANQLEAEWNDLKSEYGLKDRQLLVNEIIDHIRLDADNSLLITFLRDVCGQDTKPLEAVMEHYLEKKLEVIQARQQELRKDLADRYHVSGAAVVPNLEVDSDWTEAMRVFENNSQGKFEAEKANYK